MTVCLSDCVRWALLRAIQIEYRNSALYDSLADIFQGCEDSVIKVFQEMAAEERKHGTALKSGYRTRFGPVPLLTREPTETVKSTDLADMEAVIFDSMTLEHALLAALRAEESSRDFFRKELLRTSDTELQRIYRELAEFDEVHVRLLQETLAEDRKSVV